MLSVSCVKLFELPCCWNVPYKWICLVSLWCYWTDIFQNVTLKWSCVFVTCLFNTRETRAEEEMFCSVPVGSHQSKPASTHHSPATDDSLQWQLVASLEVRQWNASGLTVLKQSCRTVCCLPGLLIPQQPSLTPSNWNGIRLVRNTGLFLFLCIPEPWNTKIISTPKCRLAETKCSGARC